MIKSVTVTNHLGESAKIVLEDGEPEHGMIIQSIDGLGPPKANVSMSDLASMDGSIFNSARAEKRNINIHLLLTNAPTIEDSRQRVYKYFPIKKSIEFLVETDNRMLKTNGYVESNEPDIFSESESVSISLLCEKPYFYSAGKDGTVTTVLSGVEPLFEFPFSNESTEMVIDDPLYDNLYRTVLDSDSNPINGRTISVEPLLEMGSIEYKNEKTIVYDGDEEIGITVNIHAVGPATNITLYNIKAREVIRIDTDKLEAMTGYGIISGDDIVISTVKGNKFIVLIRGGQEINILNCLGKDSVWFQLVRGENTFAYVAETGANNLLFEIKNQVIYEGV